MNKRRIIAYLALQLALCFGMRLNAQTNQGVIAGTVLDSSGSAVPNATITAKGVDTGATYTAVSTSAGAYRFPSIALGR